MRVICIEMWKQTLQTKPQAAVQWCRYKTSWFKLLHYISLTVMSTVQVCTFLTFFLSDHLRGSLSSRDFSLRALHKVNICFQWLEMISCSNRVDRSQRCFVTQSCNDIELLLRASSIRATELLSLWINELINPEVKSVVARLMLFFS